MPQVLLADDERFLLSPVIDAIRERLGEEIDVVCTAMAAIRRLRLQEYRVCIVDMMLPMCSVEDLLTGDQSIPVLPGEHCGPYVCNAAKELHPDCAVVVYTVMPPNQVSVLFDSLGLARPSFPVLNKTDKIEDLLSIVTRHTRK